jgi:hypothetical protein
MAGRNLHDARATEKGCVAPRLVQRSMMLRQRGFANCAGQFLVVAANRFFHQGRS